MSSGLTFMLGMAAGFVLATLFFLRDLANRRPKRVAEVSEDTLVKARELVALGKPVQAIKVVRDETGCGLKQAKAVVDGLSRS
jgi:ribosomal protein L7/L12